MAVTGKTGADAVAKAIDKICHVLTSYHVKLYAIVDQSVVAGVISSAQGATAKAFLDSVDAACIIWKLIAGYSGF